ncbi:MAG TPA: signal recognition particle receptor subunit alpha, partial [Blastocatellia bacterium]
MALFWKRKKREEFISLGLNRAATPEEEAIARQPVEEGSSIFERFRGAVASTRQTIASRLDQVLAGKREIDAEVLDTLEQSLIEADIGVQTSMEIIEKVRQQVARNKLNDAAALKDLIRSELIAMLEAAERNRKRGTVTSETDAPPDVLPYVIMIVGVNGVGKTTTIGKLAHRIKSEGNQVIICAADTFRAA